MIRPACKNEGLHYAGFVRLFVIWYRLFFISEKRDGSFICGIAVSSRKATEDVANGSGWCAIDTLTYPPFTCSKSTVKTPEQCVKYVQSWQ